MVGDFDTRAMLHTGTGPSDRLGGKARKRRQIGVIHDKSIATTRNIRHVRWKISNWCARPIPEGGSPSNSCRHDRG